jgi:hypothetical protein
MYFEKLESFIEELYFKYNLQEVFKRDLKYLKESYIEIEALWDTQFNIITKINYVLISEAPLWGYNKKYFYNDQTNPSQFFYPSDLNNIYNQQIKNKKELLQAINGLGIIILDISPLNLNPEITAFNYRKNYPWSRKISLVDYKNIIENTAEYHLLRKLNLIINKSSNLVFLFRYARVEKFKKLLEKLFKKLDVVLDKNSFNIWQKGGGINKEILKSIIINKTV